MRYLEKIKRKWPQLVIIMLIAALILVRHYLATLEAKRKALESREFSGSIMEAVKEIYPAAHSFNRASDPAEYSTAFGNNEEPVGHFLLTSPYADEFRGYAGPVPLLLALDNNKRITTLRLLDHGESANFIDYIARKGFFNTWNGRSLGEALRLDVDAVTAATTTTAAVIGSVRKRISLLPESVRGTQDSVESKQPARVLPDITPGLMASAIVIAAALVFFFFPRPTRKLRPLLLAASVAVLGFWNGRFLSLALISGWLKRGVSWTATPVLLTLGILSLVLPLLTNRNYYCACVCPYGAAQELAGKLVKKKLPLSPRMAKTLRVLRRILLILAIAAMLFLPSFDLTMVEPFSAFLLWSPGMSMLVFGGVFLVLSLFVPRCWCRFFCPTGQLPELAARPWAARPWAARPWAARPWAARPWAARQLRAKPPASQPAESSESRS